MTNCLTIESPSPVPIDLVNGEISICLWNICWDTARDKDWVQVSGVTQEVKESGKIVSPLPTKDWPGQTACIDDYSGNRGSFQCQYPKVRERPKPCLWADCVPEGPPNGVTL